MKAVRILALTLVTFGSLAINFGCNTVEGAGKDTETAGEKLQNAANKNK